MGFTLSYMYLRTKCAVALLLPKGSPYQLQGVLNVHAVTFGLTLKKSADLEKQQDSSYISMILVTY